MTEPLSPNCGHAAARGACPISGKACPGVCIYAEILENIKIGIIVLDTGTRSLTFENRLGQELVAAIGVENEYQALLGLLIPDAVGLAEGTGPLMHELRRGKRIFGYSIYPITRGFLWVFVKDITEKERLLSIAGAVESMNNFGYVFSGIRHEIGNPVNSMKMALSVLRLNLGVFPPETVASYVDRALAEIGRIEYLLNSLKNFNLYEEPRLQRMRPEAFVDNFLQLTSKDFAAKGIATSADYPASPLFCIADSRVMHQVMLNLMTNAADAVAAVTDPRITVAISRRNGTVSLAVRDNGAGMTDEQQRSLFIPFVTSKPNGTGLGLVLVKKMLSRMGGTIEVESREGAGTTVTVLLPACDDD